MKYLIKLLYISLGCLGFYFIFYQTQILLQKPHYTQIKVNPLMVEMDQPIQAIEEYGAHLSSTRALGKRLFYDTALSQKNDLACSSCHILEQGGDDNRVISVGQYKQEGRINTPTVLNSTFNFRQFWNGRAVTLKEMIDVSVTSPSQMNNTWHLVIERLKQDAGYQAQFAEAFGSAEIQVEWVQQALADYLASLVTPNSRFDLYLKGHQSILTPDENEGYRLFREYGCIACHHGINLGGNLFAVMGVMNDYFKDKNGDNRADLGRFEYTGQEDDRHVFKVPGLRNVELTAPYFHDGQAQTLEQAVEQMAYYQLDMQLSQTEIAQMVSFLKTLTGEVKP